LIRRVAAAEVRPLRHLVLRPNRPFSETVYAGDDDPASVHFGAFAGDRLVGIASLYREDRPGGDGSLAGWRLRGMATEPSARGRGHGRDLLAACVEHVAACGGGELWCNARSPVVAFYRAAGFEVLGDEFHIPGIGPHFLMRRVVGSAR
jgi:predicted GNAT family N-acyltransferase